MQATSMQTTTNRISRNPADDGFRHASATPVTSGEPTLAGPRDLPELLPAGTPNGVLNARQPRAGWEESVTYSGAPVEQRATVSAGELGEPKERLDALVPGGDAWAEGAARLPGSSRSGRSDPVAGRGDPSALQGGRRRRRIGELNMLMLGISGKFMEERVHFRWGELLEGMDRGVIGPATVIEVAEVRASAGDVRREVVEVAGAGKDDRHRVREALELLAAAPGEGADSNTVDKLLFIALAWVFEQSSMLSDVWDVVEQIYAAFGYPKAMKPFMPYEPPAPGVVIGTAAETASRMRHAWKEFLDDFSLKLAEAGTERRDPN